MGTSNRRSSIDTRSAISNLKSAILLALGAAAAAAIFFSVPPRSERVAIPPEWQELASRTVGGAYHVHSKRSDGGGDKAAIAAAAARAGLKFVILTDHGDATREPDPPEYLNGVLCLDAVEISTSDGHYVALDMPRAPYPLGGDAASVVEDVARLGGFGIAAHPDSPKPALRWTADDLPVDGLEWLNADSEWRDETRVTLGRAALGYLMRPAEALSTLLDRPVSLARWDRWSASRPIVALAAADAHGGIGKRPEDQGGGVYARLGIPSYEASFRTFSNRVVVDRPLTGDAGPDGRSIFAAIRAGHVFSVVDSLAAPGLLDFHRDRTAIVSRAAAPPGSQLVMFHRGTEVARSSGPELRWESGGDSGSYRVEVQLSRAAGDPPIPWIVSNEVFATLAAQKPAAGFDIPWTGAFAAPMQWRIEKAPSSSATLKAGPSGIALDYRLGGNRSVSPYVAMAADVRNQSFAALEIALASGAPMRVSVQVRVGESGRWGRSVYVDTSDRLVRIPLSQMRQIDGSIEHPAPESITSVLLVVDLTNALPGASGTFTVLSLALVP